MKPIGDVTATFAGALAGKGARQLFLDNAYKI